MHEELVVVASTSLGFALKKRRIILTPQDLCKDRGLNLARIVPGAIYVDRLLGYSILRREDAELAVASRRRFDKSLSSTNLVIDIKEEHPPQKPPFKNWHIRDLGGWPEQLTGLGQRIAVLDRGIQFGLDALPRRNDHEDFCSCNGVASFANDMNGHGTLCAGVIAARVPCCEVRRSVLPDAQLISAQVAKINYSNLTTLADLLLMLSWVIHRWDVRVVSMSFCASVRNEGLHGDDVLGRVALRLRQLDRALIFSAAEEMDGELNYPASAASVIPVGAYYLDFPTIGNSQVSLLTNPIYSIQAWSGKPDLLFGPGSSLTTINKTAVQEDLFGGPSGACAFVAGVAGLYTEAYPCLSVEKIIWKMRNEARDFSGDGVNAMKWKAIRFPNSGRPSRVHTEMGRILRAVSRRCRLIWYWLLRGAM